MYDGRENDPETEWCYSARCKKCGKGLFATRISYLNGAIESSGIAPGCSAYSYDRRNVYFPSDPEKFRAIFDPVLYEKFPEFKEPHPERAEQLRMEREAQFAKEKAERAAYFANKEYFDSKKPQQPHCPNCKSTNVRPISQTKRVASTVAFGIASSTIGKSYECLNCKHKW